MKLVMTLLVRNEADVITANLDYHLAQGVDHVIVTDHGSSDGTSELLRDYERSGVVTTLQDAGQGHHQSVRVTRMARLALTEHGADWVFHNDADEFWWPQAGTLRDVFAAVPAGYGQLRVSRRNFLPGPEGPEPFYSRLVYREARSLNPSGQPLEPKVAHRAQADVVVAPGNHRISGVDLPRLGADEVLEIFHFPMRSYSQFERKVIQTGHGYEGLTQRSADVGRDQLKLLQIQREDGLRPYYEDLLVEPATLPPRLDSGEVELDRRLANFMEGLGAGDKARNAPAPQALITRTLQAAFELADARQALIDQRAELEATGEQAGRARENAAALSRELAATRAELAATLATLQSVRSSRVLRWTAPLRRVWYRLAHTGHDRR